MDFKAKMEELVKTHNTIVDHETKLASDKLKVLGAIGILQEILKEEPAEEHKEDE